MKKLISLSLVIVFLVSSSTQILSRTFASGLSEIIEKQKAVKLQMRKARHSPKKVLELRMQLLELSKEGRERRKLQLGEKKSQALLQRKSLRPVTLPTVSETPQKSILVSETGKASYYADMFNGRKTASGEIFSNGNMTAAHKTLPFGTRVRVRNLSNGNIIEVVINDRGPFTPGRIIDLTSAGFSQLDNLSRGVIDVEIEIME